MALSLNIKKSVFPFRKSKLVAVTWKNATLIWNGFTTLYLDDGYLDKFNTVNHHHRGKWTTIETSGDFPKHGVEIYEGAHVFNDKMFVLDEDSGLIVIHSLDLHSWIWEKLIPGGTVPSVATEGIRSWVFNGKIYVLGGNDLS